MQRIALPTEWTVQAVSNPEELPDNIAGKSIPAVVPGCVHLDLLRADLIPDPYLDRNELLVQWIGRTDWTFNTSFSLDGDALAHERLDLVCEGLDTVATVVVNGVEVGRSENMHVEYRFDIKAAAHEGENQISITFASAALYAREMRERLGHLPNTYPDHEPYNFIRKNACNFGWDWGPTLITCGIWKEIRLEAWSVARIKSVRPLVTTANSDLAIVDVHVEAELASADAQILPAVFLNSAVGTVAFEDDGGFSLGSDKTAWTATIGIKHPKLWWPRGYGEQPLQTLRVVLLDDSEDEVELETEIDEREIKIGLRSVELDTTPDDIGANWTLKVNGQPIWVKGANWIPDDVFLTRASESDRLYERIQQAVDANMNMLRVWGGGIFESDEFYSICDELGVLVWQDFLFACAAYSEEEPMRSLVGTEARYNVTRLSSHPSLAIWNGGNECIWGYHDWGWKETIGDRTWGAGYYFDLLPKIVAEVDPSRPYWPGSPFSGSMDIHPLADQWGNKHIWDTWNEVDHSQFRRYSPRFAAEFGHQAPPTYATLLASIPHDQLDPESPAMLHHQKANGGNGKLLARLGEQFAIPEDFDDWLYLTHVVQARAMQTAVEWFRTRKSCSGALYWQINDCWPVTSWAAIDGEGREKPLYWATQRFLAPRLLSIQPDGQGYAVWAHNDASSVWHGEVTIGLLHFDGSPLKQLTLPFYAQPRELVKVAHLDASWAPQDPARNLLTASSAGVDRAFWFYLPDRQLAYTSAATYDAELQELDGGNYALTIKAHVLLRDLTLNADRVGARVKGGFATLLPGESFTFHLESPVPLTAGQLAAPPVLQDATRFGKR